LFLERFGFPEHVVEDAALFGVALQRGLTRGGIVGDEKPLEEALRVILRRERRAVAVKGERVAVQRAASAGHVADFDGWKSRLRADLFRDDLIGGNGV